MRSSAGAGKLILFGEHAAVYGSPAVGTQLPVHTRLSWSESPNFPGGGPDFQDDSAKDQVVMRELLETAGAMPGITPPSGGVWNRKSSIPRSGGFGSSAALCVALARILLNRTETGYDWGVHRLANRLEQRFHGTPSGIDTGLSCHDGTTAWTHRPGDVPEPRLLDIPPLHLIYAALPRAAGTSASVGRLRRERTARENHVIRKLEEIADISQGFIHLVREHASHPDEFRSRTGRLVNRSQELLASIGLSVPDLERILDIARRMGMSGGKLSGGGMGGAFFLCAPDRTVRDTVLAELPPAISAGGVVLSEPLRALDLGGPLY